MGNDVIDTPNIDGLASNGVTFDRAYVNNPLCMPARACLFTGQPPRENGVRTNGIPLDDNVPTLPGALQEAGYRTYSAGKLHLKNYSLPDGVDPDTVDPEAHPESSELWNRGAIETFPEPYYGIETIDYTGGHVDYIFGEYVDWLEENHPEAAERLPSEHPDNVPYDAPGTFRWSIPEEVHYNRWTADRTRDFLRSDHGGDPFFAWCSFPDPHHPFAAPEPWGSKYDPGEVSLPTRRDGELEDLPPHYRDAYEKEDTALSGLGGSAEIDDDHLRRQIALTYGMVSFVDNEIGRVLRTLEEDGLREDTVVVFLSDHGDMMGDHWMIRKGPFHFEGLLRVSFIWSYPGEFESGVRTEGLASHLDLMPTVLDLCDIPIPEGKRPATPVTENQPQALPGTSLVPQLRGETDGVNEHVIVENEEDYLGLRIRTYTTDRYKLTVYPREDYGELYDIQADPDEFQNLWDRPDYRELRDRLYREFLEAYIEQETGLPRRLSHA